MGKRNMGAAPLNSVTASRRMPIVEMEAVQMEEPMEPAPCTQKKQHFLIATTVATVLVVVLCIVLFASVSQEPNLERHPASTQLDYSGAGVPVTELSSIFRRRRRKIGTSIEHDADDAGKDADDAGKDADDAGNDADDAGDDIKTDANDVSNDISNNWPSKEQICSDAVNMAVKTLGDKVSGAAAYCDEFCTDTAGDIDTVEGGPENPAGDVVAAAVDANCAYVCNAAFEKALNPGTSDFSSYICKNIF